MNYVKSYESLDWPLVSGQTGLDVQLPGSENLLPVQNGYLLDDAANLLQGTKHHSQVEDFLDIIEDSDWNSLELPASVDFYHSDLVLDAFDLLPASPENVLLDLNVLDQYQGLSQAALDRKSLDDNTRKFENLVDEVAVPSSELHLNVKSYIHETKNVPEDIFESGCLCDFDPTWLLLPVPVLPSLEDVESVLSDSPPLDIISDFFSDEDSLSPTGIETHSFATSPLHFPDTQLENVQLSGSPLDLFLAEDIGGDCSVVTACSSVQAPQDVTWIGDSAAEHSLGLYNRFFEFDGTSLMVTSSDSLSSLESSQLSSPSDIEAEPRSSSSSPQPVRLSTFSASLRVEPYPTTGVRPERRERKREQNKTAAVKYRQKKRAEQGVYHSECDILEKRNSELKGRVEELTREISYLKNLITEIYSSQAD